MTLDQWDHLAVAVGWCLAGIVGVGLAYLLWELVRGE